MTSPPESGARTWTRIDEALCRALEQPADERQRWVETEYRKEPALRDALLKLLADDNASAKLFEAALAERDAIAGAAADDGPSALGYSGQRLGPWLLRDLVATGGMGAVYRAERADGEYQQAVAVKLLPAWAADPQTIARLRPGRWPLRRLRASRRRKRATRLTNPPVP